MPVVVSRTVSDKLILPTAKMAMIKLGKVGGQWLSDWTWVVGRAVAVEWAGSDDRIGPAA